MLTFLHGFDHSAIISEALLAATVELGFTYFAGSGRVVVMTGGEKKMRKSHNVRHTRGELVSYNIERVSAK